MNLKCIRKLKLGGCYDEIQAYWAGDGLNRGAERVKGEAMVNSGFREI